MKRVGICVLWGLWMALAAVFPLCGKDAAGSDAVYTVPTNSIRVSVSLVGPPTIGSKIRKNVDRLTGRYMQVDIQFSFKFPVGKGKEIILLERPSVELYMGGFRMPKRWFWGVQKIHTILLDPRHKGRKYNVSLFLPPNYVYAFLPREKNTDKYDLRALSGVVQIRSAQGELLGQKAFRMRGGVNTKESNALIRYADSLRMNKNVPQFFWPREKTPWAWVDSDGYELPLTELPGRDGAKNGKREE